jgi:TonB family protein
LFYTGSLTLLLSLFLGGLIQTIQPDIGRISGRAVDSNGVGTEGTAILSTVEGRTVALAATTATGDFVFERRSAGAYVIQVFAVGFDPWGLTNVQLEAGAELRQNVILEIVVSPEGAVRKATIIAGHPLLQQSALDCVMIWHFKPFLSNGTPVEMVGTVTVNFNLGNVQVMP